MVAQNKWEDYAYLIGFIVNVPLANWVIAMLVSHAFRTGRAPHCWRGLTASQRRTYDRLSLGTS